MSLLFVGFCAGVIVGLIFGPDSEREHAASVNGWISGYHFARSEQDKDLGGGK